MENFLENNILESDRLTKRINLRKKFNMSNLNFNSVKIDFINKCSQQQKENSNHKIKERDGSHVEGVKELSHCKIPGAIKHIYSSMKEASYEEFKQDVSADRFDDSNNVTRDMTSKTFVDDNEKESVSDAFKDFHFEKEYLGNVVAFAFFKIQNFCHVILDSSTTLVKKLSRWRTVP